MPSGPKSNYQTPDQSPGFLLWQVNNAWQALQREALQPLGLTHVQFVLLAALVHLSDKKKLTQKQLAEFTHIDVMMTSQVVRTLEGKGLLMRTPHDSDKRAITITTTAEGKALAKKAILVVEETDAHFFSKLTNQQSSLINLLQRLRS